MCKYLLLVVILGLVSENLCQNSGRGICSWYGAEGEIPPGWPTACGEGFNRFAMAAAHPSLPCGTHIRVTNERNKKSVTVRVNDRGPFVPGRIVDLTYAAFGEIENRDVGIVECHYNVVHRDPNEESIPSVLGDIPSVDIPSGYIPSEKIPSNITYQKVISLRRLSLYKRR